VFTTKGKWSFMCAYMLINVCMFILTTLLKIYIIVWMYKILLGIHNCIHMPGILLIKMVSEDRNFVWLGPTWGWGHYIVVLKNFFLGLLVTGYVTN